MLLAEIFDNESTGKLLVILVIIVAVLLLLLYAISKVGNKKNKPAKENKPKPARVKPEKVKKEKKEKKAKVKKAKKQEEEQAPVEEEKYETDRDAYVSPLILDRTKYEIALQEKLAREKQERLNRQAAETARMEALKNKEFQSHAGFITTLQRFSKKDALEKQISETGKVDREMLDTYLNEKGTTISEEFANMSPELKAVILSDLMNRKY
jgi:Na+-transporting methylmalonyl-CoA/oxaloacetate decarboxylase gamma subunit